MKKQNRIKAILILLGIICFLILSISAVHIVTWKKDAKKIQDQLEIIQEVTKMEEIKDNESVEIIEPKEELPAEDPYWSYVNMSLIHVDFTELKKINSNTKGWIQVNGTNVDYPFVQAKDNKYYLKHAFDDSYNEAGWVFLDYRNQIEPFDKNTILYAHGRLDETMFGSLRNILNNGWLKKSENFVMKLSTEKANTLWQIFSVYRIPTTNDYIRITFSDDDDFERWVSILKTRSAYDFKTEVAKEDYVLTLSTCYNEKEKMVLHAKLLKVEKRS